MQKHCSILWQEGAEEEGVRPRSTTRQRRGTSTRRASTTSMPSPENYMAKMEKAKAKTKAEPVRVQALHKNKKTDRAKLCPVYLRKV